MARIDRTLAEANRTLGQNLVEHGVKKIRKTRRRWEEWTLVTWLPDASEHAPDFIDGIKV